MEAQSKKLQSEFGKGKEFIIPLSNRIQMDNVAFLDIEKAFDNIPRRLVYSLKRRRLYERYCNSIASMYKSIRS